MAHGFVLCCVPEHQPFSLSGQRSVTLSTILFVSAGKYGGVVVYVFSSVKRKHLPQPAPYEVLLP